MEQVNTKRTVAPRQVRAHEAPPREISAPSNDLGARSHLSLPLTKRTALRLQASAGNAAVARMILRDAAGPKLVDEQLHLDLPARTRPVAEIVEGTPEDQAEFKLLGGNAKLADEHKIPMTTVKDYLRQRRRTFPTGDLTDPDAAYHDFASESDAELDADAALPPKKRLRWQLEYGNNPAAQTIFYRWVRKGLMDQGVELVPAYIRRGMARGDRVKAIVRAEAESLYGKKYADRERGQGGRLHLEGPNPRPVKTGGEHNRYQLGTISEHTSGSAVDIDTTRTAALSNDEWAWLEAFTGLRATRGPQAWQTDPKKLYDEIVAVNDAFVTRIGSLIERELRGPSRDARHHLLPGKLRRPEILGPDPHEPTGSAGQSAHLLDEQLTAPALIAVDTLKPDHPAVKKVFARLASPKLRKDLAKWKNGFIDLDWALVERLWRKGLVWGGSFTSKVDLHHFELPKGVLEQEEAPYREAERHEREVKERAKRYHLPK